MTFSQIAARISKGISRINKSSNGLLTLLWGGRGVFLHPVRVKPSNACTRDFHWRTVSGGKENYLRQSAIIIIIIIIIIIARSSYELETARKKI